MKTTGLLIATVFIVFAICLSIIMFGSVEATNMYDTKEELK